MSNIDHFQKLLAIPELAITLSTFISQEDLCQCIRVSSSWYKRFLPYLWKSFDLSRSRSLSKSFDNVMNGKSKDRRNREWFMAVFNKHAHFIKNLAISTRFLLGCIDSSQLQNPTGNLMLESISIYGEPPSIMNEKVTSNDDAILASRLRKFLCSQEHMKSLSFNPISDGITEILTGLVLNISELLPSLNSLTIPIPPGARVQLPPNVQRITTFIIEDDVIFSPNSKLKIFTLWYPTLNNVLNILESHPGLEELNMKKGVEERNSLNLIKTKYPSAPYHLQKLSFDDFNVSALDAIIPLIPNLIEISLETLTHDFAEVIAKNLKLIQEIRISVHNFDPDRSVDEEREDVLTPLLTSCMNLKVLSAQYIMLDAKTALNRPWVCRNLEELHCRVVGFPHFEEDELETLKQGQEKQKHNEKLWDDEGIIARRWVPIVDLKQRFYKQLSLMTSLRRLTIHSELRVGHIGFLPSLDRSDFYQSQYISTRDGNIYYEYDSPPEDSLTMRLEDGLGQISTLTKLEYLEFEHMNHRMEREEIEWIAQTFPRLKEVQGLMHPAHLGLEPNAKNKELHDLLRELRGDIKHSRRFDAKTSGILGFNYED